MLTIAEARELEGRRVTWRHPTDSTRAPEEGVLTVADTADPALVKVLYDGQAVSQYTDPKHLTVNHQEPS